jgi:hypothetical protein
MIPGDQENTAQEPLPLGIFIHLMGWIGRISLVLIYHLAMIPFVLIVIGFGLYVILTFLSIVYQLLLQAPLLLGVSLIATPTILLILNYLMDLKFWNK